MSSVAWVTKTYVSLEARSMDTSACLFDPTLLSFLQTSQYIRQISTPFVIFSLLPQSPKRVWFYSICSALQDASVKRAAWLRAPATLLSVGPAPYTPPGPRELVIRNGAVGRGAFYVTQSFHTALSDEGVHSTQSNIIKNIKIRLVNYQGWEPLTQPVIFPTWASTSINISHSTVSGYVNTDTPLKKS